MKIAIYSRGMENSQLQDINLLLEELLSYGAEPVIFQDFLIRSIRPSTWKENILHLIRVMISTAA
jgi:hypothetical protein